MGVSGIQIVRVGPEAFQVISELYGRSFDEPWPEPSVRELLSAPLVWAMVALDEKTSVPCGFIIARVVVDEGEVLSIGVDPKRQRRGTGAILLNGCLDRMAQVGAETVYLEVAADNVGAIALYESRGFNRCGVRKGYYLRKDGNRYDAILMKIGI